MISKSMFKVSFLACVFFLSEIVLAEDLSSQTNLTRELNKFSSNMEKRDLSKSELEQLVRLVNENSDSAQAHSVLARAYELSGLEEFSLEESVAAWELNKGDIQAFVAAQSMALRVSNRTVYEQLNSKALSHFKNDSRSLNTLAAICEKRGESEIARRFLKASLMAAPNDLDARILYLGALLADHRYEEILKELDALHLQKENAENKRVENQIATFRGIALLRLNRAHAALKYLELAFAASPTNLAVCNAYFDALVATGRYKSAVYPGMMLLALQPPFGDALERTKKKLQPTFEKASIHASPLKDNMHKIDSEIKDRGRLAYFSFALADLMDDIGSYAQAEYLFSYGLNLDSSFGRGYMRLAKVMEKLGRDPDVVKDLHKSAMEADSKDPEIVAGYKRSITRDASRKNDLAGRTKNLIRARR